MNRQTEMNSIDIKITLTPEEHERALHVLRHAYSCAPGFDVAELASLALDRYCEEMGPIIARKLSPPANVVKGPWPRVRKGGSPR